MSVRATSWVWTHSQTTGIDLLVLLAIADVANDDGENAWPTAAWLAAKTRLHERTIERSILRLRDYWDELSWQTRGHDGRSNVYRLTKMLLTRKQLSKPKSRRATPGAAPEATPGAAPEIRLTFPAPESEALPAPESEALPALAPEQYVHVHPSTRTTAAAPPSALARDPNGNGNYRVIERLAIDVLNGGKIDTEAELIDAVKTECAKLNIDYGREVAHDVVHRACASALVKHRLFGKPV